MFCMERLETYRELTVYRIHYQDIIFLASPCSPFSACLKHLRGMNELWWGLSAIEIDDQSLGCCREPSRDNRAKVYTCRMFGSRRPILWDWSWAYLIQMSAAGWQVLNGPRDPSVPKFHHMAAKLDRGCGGKFFWVNGLIIQQQRCVNPSMIWYDQAVRTYHRLFVGLSYVQVWLTW